MRLEEPLPPDLAPEAAASITCFVEEADDVWTLYSLIEKGDEVSCNTTRKVKGDNPRAASETRHMPLPAASPKYGAVTGVVRPMSASPRSASRDPRPSTPSTRPRDLPVASMAHELSQTAPRGIDGVEAVLISTQARTWISSNIVPRVLRS